jgi:hypothetical protein
VFFPLHRVPDLAVMAENSFAASNEVPVELQDDVLQTTSMDHYMRVHLSWDRERIAVARRAPDC